MAKRKRLTPVPTNAPLDTPPLETKGLTNGWAGVRKAPIADVAGASAAQAALEEVADQMADARREGRLVQRLPLDAIDETYLVRDRAVVDAEDMTALEQSLRSRGQQTPIEVVALGGERYGLISGWRRLIALRRLRADAQSDAFADVLCLVRAPQSASEAYLAMVEENEIRAGLSYYERARIAARAAEQGAYPTATHAVKGLFANASASKRSKIRSFLTLYTALDEALRFPGAISERLGLALAKRLEGDPVQGRALALALSDAQAPDAAAEQAILSAALAPPKDSPTPPAPVPQQSTEAPAKDSGIRVIRSKGRVTLSGDGVTDDLMDALEAWLASRS